MISEDSDFLHNLNMSFFFQHAKMFGSARAYFSCVVLTGRDLTLPIKRSLKKKKERRQTAAAAVSWKCSYSARPSASQKMELSAASCVICSMCLIVIYCTIYHVGLLSGFEEVNNLEMNFDGLVCYFSWCTC